MYNGEGCAADIAVTCPLRDVYAQLADGMSPADHYAAAEKHSKYESFVGSVSPSAQLYLIHLVVCQQRA